jgi:hypothetical protein
MVRMVIVEWNSGQFSGENGECLSGTVDSSVVRIVSGTVDSSVVRMVSG